MPTSYGHRCFRQFLFRATDVADLGDRVNPDREQLAHRSVLTEGVCGGEAPLLHRSGCERRPAEDVARSEDVLDGGPVVRTDDDPPALVGLQASTLELEVLRLPLATGGVEDDLGGDLLPARELRQRAVGMTLNGGHFLTQAEDDTDVAQVVLQTLRDLGIAEVEQARAFLNDRDLCAERCEHGGVLDADHPRTYDDHRVRDSGQSQQAVGIEDRSVVEFHVGRVGWACPRGNDDPVRTTCRSSLPDTATVCASKKRALP